MEGLKEQLKETLKKYEPYPDDIILALFMEADITTFSQNAKVLHTAVRTMKKREPKIFHEFTFATSGTFPYCDLLERVKGRWLVCRIIGICWDNWEFSDSTKEYYDDSVVKRLDCCIKQIKGLAEEFKTLITEEVKK